MPRGHVGPERRNANDEGASWLQAKTASLIALGRRYQIHRDAGEQARCLTAWQHCYSQLSPGPFEGEVEEFELGTLLVYRERLNRVVLQSGCAAPDLLSIGTVVAMEGGGLYNGASFDAPALLASRPGAAFEFRTPREQEIVAFGIPKNVFEAYVDLTEGPEAWELLERLPDVCVNAVLRRELHQLFACAQAATRSPAGLRRLAAEEIKAAVLACIVSCCDSDRVTRCALPRVATSRHRMFRRADQYIREHAGEPIGIDTLCRVAHASRRTLQYCFASLTGVNPLAYVRCVRLNGARHALRQVREDGQSVADIAAAWGFWHLSRFAQQYRQMFGELPSQTLAHGRAGTVRSGRRGSA